MSLRLLVARSVVVERLLAACKKRDIQLGAAGDTLCFSAPVGALTAGLRKALAENRTAILAALRAAEPPAPTPATSPVQPPAVGNQPRAVDPACCPSCHKPLDAKARCWRCHYRTCGGCGKDTGSAFLALCITCGMLETS
jgi:hypothetical protein